MCGARIASVTLAIHMQHHFFLNAAKGPLALGSANADIWYIQVLLVAGQSLTAYLTGHLELTLLTQSAFNSEGANSTIIIISIATLAAAVVLLPWSC